MTEPANTTRIIGSDRFELHPADEAAIRRELEHYEQPQAACIEALKIIQRRHGWVPDGAIPAIARVLGIPNDPVEACEILLDGHTRKIDAGDVDGETYVGIASVGLESEVTRMANAMPRAFGQASYLIATFVGLARWKPATFALEIDGVERDFTGYIAAAANSPCFGGGMRFAPDAKLDDGQLDVVVIEQGPRALFVVKAPQMFKGTHVNDARVHVFRGSEVTFRTDRPFEVYADGDVIGKTPATARALPGALTMLAPPASA